MLNAQLESLVCPRRGAALAVLLAAALWLGAGGGAEAAENGRFFRIGSGSEASSEFLFGQRLATLLRPALSPENCRLPDCPAVAPLVAVQRSAGSLANLRDLAGGRLEAALVAAPAAGWAARGEGPFAQGPLENLRAVTGLYPTLLQVVTLKDGGIARLADLRGRRVSLGQEGSATRPLARRVLAAYGLSEDAVQVRGVAPDTALERLAAGKLDAVFALGTLPLEAVARVGEIAEIRLLPVRAERLAGDRVLDATIRPGWVPAGRYPGLTETETLASAVQLLVRADLAPDLVYALTARLWEAELVMAGAPTTAIEGLALPLHAGAERYYRERGLLP